MFKAGHRFRSGYRRRCHYQRWIGGDFEDGHGLPNADNLIIYDASTSTFTAPPVPLNGPVRAVAKVGSNLYVGGTFDRINANTNLGYFTRWNSAAMPPLWETAGGGMGISGNAVNALVKRGSSEIVIGGDFSDAGGNSNADNIARFDEPGGQILSLDPMVGLNGPVVSLVYDGTGVYAAGSFTDAGGNVASDRIAKFATGWGPVQNGLSSGEALAVSHNGSQIFLGSDFTSVSSATDTKCIGRFNGSTWSSVAGGLNGKVTAIDHYAGSNAYIGGEFDDGAIIPVL